MLQDEYKIMYNSETTYWWYVGLHELIKSIVVKKSREAKLSILDAGCGTGRFLELISEYNSLGFDFSEDAINFCKLRGLKNVFIQDLNLWNVSNKYNFIVSADVICSVGIEDEQKIISNFYSSLANDGLLILNLPAFNILQRNHDKAVFVRKRYKRKEVKNMLEKAGFVNIYLNYRLPWLFIIILIKKIIQKLFNITEIKSDLNKLPKFVNSFFLFLNRIDNFFIKKRIYFPFGSSVFVIAKK